MNGLEMLEEVAKICSGDRQEAYGSPLDNHRRIAKLWSVYLGVEIRPRQVGMMLVLLKIARDMNAPKTDNVMDIAGYAVVLQEIADAEALDGIDEV